MTGVFSVAREGLFDVSVDELLQYAQQSREPERPQSEVNEEVCAKALAYIKSLDLAEVAGIENRQDAERVLNESTMESAVVKLKALIDALPEGRVRKRVLHKLRRHIAASESEMRARQRKTEAQTKYLRQLEAAALDLRAWEQLSFKLERPSGSYLHKFREALRFNRVYDIRALQCTMPAAEIAEWRDVAEQCEVFVVEHNWAAAFSGATDYEFGEVRLPAEACAFEFRVSARPVITFAIEVDGTIYLQTTVMAAGDHWLVYDLEAGPLETASRWPLVRLVTDQIRAIVIALDAEVAVTEVIRAPHKLNAARERSGKLPIASYHIVRLAERSRVMRLPADDEPPSHHKRLHFRRGHWRHFETWKTWIRWTLVGDPDLGFVDKHYRL